MSAALRRVTTALLLAASTAGWAGAGDHVRIGDTTTLTPRLSLLGEYHSNPYLSVGAVQSTLPVDQREPSFAFVVQPELGILVKTPKIRWTFDGRYTLRKFFKPEVADDLDQFSNFRVATRLDALPDSVVGFHLRDTAQLRNRADDRQFFDNALISQLRNVLGGGLVFRVGPEFTIDTTMDWAFHNFRVPGVDGQRALNQRNTYTPGLELNWRFFPKTSFVVEGHVDINEWQTNWLPTSRPANASSASRNYQDFLAMPDSTHVKAATGLRGRITEVLNLDLLVGYGTALYSVKSVQEEAASDPGIGNESDPVAGGYDDNVTGLDGLLVLARGRLDLGYTQKRTLGQQVIVQYRKDFTDSWFTNYVHSHHLTGSLQSRWGRYVGSDLSFDARFEDYAGEVTRRDIFLVGDGQLAFFPTRWFEIDAGVRWTQRASSQTDAQYDNVVGRLVLGFSY